MDSDPATAGATSAPSVFDPATQFNLSPYIDSLDRNNTDLSNAHVSTIGARRTVAVLDDAVSNVSITPLQGSWVHIIADWFYSIENSWAGSKYTSATKFHKAVHAIGPDIFPHISDLARTHSTGDDPYNAFKTAVIARLSLSPAEHIAALLTKEELGDSTPSALLRRLRTHNGSAQFPAAALTAIWLDRLPAETQRFLVAHASSTADQQAVIADALHKIKPSGQVAMEIESKEETVDIAAELRKINKRIDALQVSHNGRRENSTSRFSRSSGHRFRSKSRDRRSPNKIENGMCWYHKKFQQQAQKCSPGCKFFAKFNQGNALDRC